MQRVGRLTQQDCTDSSGPCLQVQAQEMQAGMQEELPSGQSRYVHLLEAAMLVCSWPYVCVHVSAFMR
jgi:hypothetical protein